MAGNREGGYKARDTNIKHNGADFYRKIGAIGGKNGHTGGFAANIVCNCHIVGRQHYKQHCAGVKGGITSRRYKDA